MAYTSELFESVIPDGWNELQPGWFARGNPEIDKTLLIQLAAPTESADEMISGVLGEFGLTVLPDPLRTLPTDSLTWNLFLPAGMVPTVIAKSQTGQATYMVMLVATKGELDSLIDAVLIPAIMASAKGVSMTLSSPNF